MAGYSLKEDHHLRRGRVQPDDVLLQMIFPWVDTEMEKLQAHLVDTDKEKQTAWAFLLLLKRQRQIILQDTAAMLVANPDRYSHWIFQLDVFKSDKFQKYVSQMKEALSESIVEKDSRAVIDKALTGMNGRFDVLENQLDQKLQTQTEILAETMKDVVTYIAIRNKEEMRTDIAYQLTETAR